VAFAPHTSHGIEFKSGPVQTFQGARLARELVAWWAAENHVAVAYFVSEDGFVFGPRAPGFEAEGAETFAEELAGGSDEAAFLVGFFAAACFAPCDEARCIRGLIGGDELPPGVVVGAAVALVWVVGVHS